MSKKETFYCWVYAGPNGRPDAAGVKRGRAVYTHPLIKTGKCMLTRYAITKKELEQQMNLQYPPRNGEVQWGLMEPHQIKAAKIFYKAVWSRQ